MSETSQQERWIRSAELRQRFSVSHTTLWRMTKRPDFPRSVRLSAGVVAWKVSDIIAFEQARAESR